MTIQSSSLVCGSRKTPAFLFAFILVAAAADAQEVRVMTSGAFMGAYLQLAPEFERATHSKAIVISGGSMGNDPNTIPNRLRRGEPADVVILADSALDALVKDGRVVAGSQVPLVRSIIGMAVRAGAPKPDISTVDALKQTLLRARSIAYSGSASGVYLSTELFPRLGVADQIRGKIKLSEAEPVGEVVARGGAEIGFQQVSELLPVAGIDYVGPLPAGAQRVTVFSAGIVVGARAPETARALIAFLTSPAAAPVIRKNGLEPITAAR
ncbi:MAG: substrate-binding domain-containing protein [Vicinamibacterales bacterium]